MRVSFRRAGHEGPRARRLAPLAAALLALAPLACPGALAQREPAVYAEAPVRLLYGTLHAVTFHPEDRALVATAGGVGAVLWNLERGEPVRFLDLPEFPADGPGRYALALGFSPDGGTLLALYGDDCASPPRTVLRWNLDDGSVTAWPGAASPPDLRADLEGALCQPLWNLAGSELTFAGAFPGADGAWNRPESLVLASPSGRLEVETTASTSSPATLRVTGAAAEIVVDLTLPPGDWAWSVVFSADETRAAVLLAPAALGPPPRNDPLELGRGVELGRGSASAYRVVVLELERGGTTELDGHAALPEALAFGLDGSLTLLHDGRQVKRFGLTGGAPELERAVTLELAPAGQRQLVADGGAVLQATGGLGLTLIPLDDGGTASGAPSWQSEPVALRVVLPDERLEETAVTTLAALLERLAAPTPPLAFPLGGGGAAFSTGGDLLATSAPSGVWLWRFAPGDRRGTLAGRLEAPGDALLDALRFGPPGSDLLAGYSALEPADCEDCEPRPGGVRLWNVVTGELLLSIPLPPQGSPLALTAERLAAATGFWDVRSGALLCGWQPVTAVALGPYLALGNAEGVVSLLDARSCEALAPLPGLRDRIEELTFSPDGRWLAARARDGQVLLWPIPARR